VYRKDICQFQAEKIKFCQNVDVHCDEHQRRDGTKDLLINIVNSSLTVKISTALLTNVGYSQDINNVKLELRKQSKRREYEFVKRVSLNIK
jgi:hypothetical protein